MIFNKTYTRNWTK